MCNTFQSRLTNGECMLKDEYQHKDNFVPLRGVKVYAQVSSIVKNVCQIVQNVCQSLS